MSRRGSLAALALSLALVVGSVVALAAGVALGTWRPAGPAPATPSPTPFAGTDEIRAFLDEVRAGLVLGVVLRGTELSVDGVERDYTVELPNESYDIFSAISAAADDGGVPQPQITVEGPKADTITYPEFLDLVRAGAVGHVEQIGDSLSAYSGTGEQAWQVDVPPGTENVLADIENAAAEGGVVPPYYAKSPPQFPD